MCALDLAAQPPDLACQGAVGDRAVGDRPDLAGLGALLEHVERTGAHRADRELDRRVFHPDHDHGIGRDRPHPVEQRERAIVIAAELGIEQHEIERRSDDSLERDRDRTNGFDFDAAECRCGTRNSFGMRIDDQNVAMAVLHEPSLAPRPAV